jgi:hypothetical protein
MSNRLVRAGVSIALAAVTVACGSSAPSSPPPATVSVTATPDLHLTAPATADVVMSKLVAAGLRIVPNNASRGQNGEPVKSVNATFNGWPLTISQYTTSQAMKTVADFVAGGPPKSGDAPFRIAGLNILIEYGPPIHDGDAAPPERYRTSVVQLSTALDPLLGPLEVSSVTQLPVPTATVAATATPTATAAPSRRSSPGTPAGAPSASSGP